MSSVTGVASSSMTSLCNSDIQLFIVPNPASLNRFDFAWPQHMIAVEIEGGTWNQGRHVTGAGFAKDCEKYNLAALDGWSVYRFPTKMVTDETAIKFMHKVFIKLPCSWQT